MSVGNPPNTISRIRTFKGDAVTAQERAQINATQVAESETSRVTPIPTPPVLKIPKKESPVPTPPVKPLEPSILKDEIAQVGHAHRTSILSDEDNYDENHLGDGRIIKDTKHKRFKLAPAVGTAVTSWLKDTKTAFENRNPEPTIMKAEARIDVIEKAVQQSERAPQEDFKAVAEHLKTVERKEISTSVSFKDKSEVPAPSWSYVVDGEEDAGTAEVRSDAVAELNESVQVIKPIEQISNTAESIMGNEPVHAQEEKREQEIDTALHVLFEPSKTPPTPKIEAVVIPEIRIEPPTLVVPEKPVVVTPAVERVLEPIVVVTPIEIVPHISVPVASIREYREPEIVQEEPPIKVPEITTPKNVPVPYAPPRSVAPSSFPIYILLGVIIVASLLGVLVTYMYFDKTTAPTSTATVYSIPSLVSAQESIPVVLGSTRSELFFELEKIIENQNGVTQLYATTRSEMGDEKPATAEEILSVLGLRAPGSFTRSIKELVFGGDSHKKPFMVIKATSFDTAFAGMLAWEASMSADLSPYFGEPVRETFDSQARTDTQTTSSFFKDVIASNKNVRLLQDESGQDRIVYTFIDEHTILIATHRDMLDALIPLIK